MFYKCLIYCRTLTWEKAKNILQNQTNKSALAKLYQYAKQISLSDNKEITEATAIYLLQMFLKEKVLCKKHIQQLKEKFGSVPHNLLQQIFQVRIFLYRFESMIQNLTCM